MAPPAVTLTQPVSETEERVLWTAFRVTRPVVPAVLVW